MGQFASTLAHELGQPLTTIQSYVVGIRHRLSDVLSSRPDVLLGISMIERHLERAGQIVQNVRAFVSRNSPAREQVNLEELIGQTINLVELQLKSESVRLTSNVSDLTTPLSIAANRVEIQQVLMNLIVNAIEAMHDVPLHDRHIFLEVRCDSRDFVAIQVTDNGLGVPPNLAARIFEPYVTTKGGGLGMGLAISKSIVESHGGMLTLLKPRKRGAAFRFTLPTPDEPL
jgi:C4-dicarboxylate-specific signal transduction histidine kinase